MMRRRGGWWATGGDGSHSEGLLCTGLSVCREGRVRVRVRVRGERGELLWRDECRGKERNASPLISLPATNSLLLPSAATNSLSLFFSLFPLFSPDTQTSTRSAFLQQHPVCIDLLRCYGYVSFGHSISPRQNRR